MTVSGINATLLPLLQQLQSAQGGNTASSTGSTQPTSGSASYNLTVGQQQTASSLLGYDQLGQLINQTGTTLSGLAQSNPGETVTAGDGKPLEVGHVLDVLQLAQPQTVTSGTNADSSTTVVGTGTLKLQMGSIASGSGDFTPTGTPIAIPITDGTLTGIASAINAAGAGITASVIGSSDGNYQLELTGQSGAANAFSLSGIEALSYDPSGKVASALTTTQVAQDAQYTVDAGPVQTSATNQLTLLPGETITVTATGVTTTKQPLQESASAAAAQSLVKTINALINQVKQMTGSGGALAADNGTGSDLVAALDKTLQQNFAGSGNQSSLASIGLSIQTDGTLSIDNSQLQAASAADPQGTSALINAAAKAAQQSLTSSGGSASTVQAELTALIGSLNQGLTLASYLGQSSNSSDPFSSSSDPFASLLGAQAVNVSQAAASYSVASSLGTTNNSASVTG
ncbi:MAG TPA: flagellar filament capping protein FliD [Rhodospirillaceae bacterium]|nr:flagellar filament capping protein FliD [Rhodospirillaceae bacterium]